MVPRTLAGAAELRACQPRGVIPPRDATDAYMDSVGRAIDISFDVDLGELVRGHHVVARGLELGTPTGGKPDDRATAAVDRAIAEPNSPPYRSRLTIDFGSDRAREVPGTRASEPQLHYEFVPGIEAHEDAAEPFFWYWMLRVSDDVGTQYRNDNGGVRGPSAASAATHATRDLGGQIPDAATRLVLEFEPPPRWVPPEPWCRELSIDLATRRVIQ
jgi:hypothetical protein